MTFVPAKKGTPLSAAELHAAWGKPAVEAEPPATEKHRRRPPAPAPLPVIARTVTLREVAGWNPDLARLLRELGAKESGQIEREVVEKLPMHFRSRYDKIVDEVHSAAGFHRVAAAMGVIGGAGLVIGAVAAAPALSVVCAAIGAVGLLTGSVPTCHRIHDFLQNG